MASDGKISAGIHEPKSHNRDCINAARGNHHVITVWARAPHRGAHLRRLPGLLSPRHAARTAQAAGAWPYAESCARQVRRDPNARRAFPHHRRPHLDSQPLHRTHRRPETSGPPTQTRSPTTAAATHNRARKDRSPPSQRRVVETFTMPALILLTFFAELVAVGTRVTPRPPHGS